LSKIISIATGVPDYKHQQNDIFEFADIIYSHNTTDTRKLKYLYSHSGIDSRYSVLPDYSTNAENRQFYSKSKDMEPFPDLEKRMKWFSDNVTTLSVKTLKDCIAGQINPQEITHLITVSCTGMSAPGMDLEIMEAMDLPADIFRTSVNFMGCYAAIHALKIADAFCNSDIKANVVIVCTELCTLHFQKENSIDNITSTLLFADGCAAVLVKHNKVAEKGLILTNFFSSVAFKGKKDMSWQLSSKGFLMTLTGYVPDLIKEDFYTLLSKALQNAGIEKEAINYWCIHPGGKKILESIQQSTGLNQKDLQYSYDTLREYGNMSSPTILFVLYKILQELQLYKNNNAIIFGAAFGPGLTMETFIANYQ
jgi:predicted naringenin-chalcone synthase